MSSIRATVTICRKQTRVLVQDVTGDLLIARLGPLEDAHRYALRGLLEAVALWTQQPVHVVLFADDGYDWHRTSLVDALDFARENLLLRVELAPTAGAPPRPKRLTGLGSFERERRILRLRGV